MTANNNENPSSDLALLHLLVQFHREQHQEFSELWRNLDTKAQGVIALAGILLAAFVAFITKVQSPVSVYDRVLSFAAVSLFTGSMVASMLSLRLREGGGSPYQGGAIQSAVKDLLQLPEQDRADRMLDLIREELSLWEECNAAADLGVSRKTTLLAWGQTLIVLSIACLAAIATLRILE